MAEKEYIEREAAIEEVRLTYCKYCNSYNGIRCRACEFDDAMSLIEDVPAADVVEVVRCKDCVYYEVNQNNGKEKVCKYWSDWVYTEPDGFCSRGERREHDHT